LNLAIGSSSTTQTAWQEHPGTWTGSEVRNRLCWTPTT
jgi:hypothetical protein